VETSFEARKDSIEYRSARPMKERTKTRIGHAKGAKVILVTI
jgi:hypothetical protein